MGARLLRRCMHRLARALDEVLQGLHAALECSGPGSMLTTMQLHDYYLVHHYGHILVLTMIGLLLCNSACVLAAALFY